MQEVPCPHPVVVRPSPGAASEAVAVPESPAEPPELAPLPLLPPPDDVPCEPLDVPVEPLEPPDPPLDAPGPFEALPVELLLHAAMPRTRAAQTKRVPKPNTHEQPSFSRFIFSPSTLLCASDAQTDHRPRATYYGDLF
jgi:hypothetical protein